MLVGVDTLVLIIGLFMVIDGFGLALLVPELGELGHKLFSTTAYILNVGHGPGIDIHIADLIFAELIKLLVLVHLDMGPQVFLLLLQETVRL